MLLYFFRSYIVLFFYTTVKMHCLSNCFSLAIHAKAVCPYCLTIVCCAFLFVIIVEMQDFSFLQNIHFILFLSMLIIVCYESSPLSLFLTLSPVTCKQCNEAKLPCKIWKTLLIVCLPIDWRLSVCVCVYGVSPTARAAVCWQTWPAAKAIAIIIKIRLTVGNGRGRQVFTVGCYFCNGT